VLCDIIYVGTSFLNDKENKMSITLPLEKMTIAEKLQTMEFLWDDLCHNADEIKSPKWHKDVLSEREKNIKNGRVSFIDWEQAKKEISEAIK
jgi:hypothetical protein